MNQNMGMNIEEGDRLSNLSNDLIHKILSSFNLRDVIRMSVLSSRWRFIWTSMPHLNISYDGFLTLSKFSEFVSQVLFRRDNVTNVYSMKIDLCVTTNHAFCTRILKYAVSHNIQQLSMVYSVDHKENVLPLCLSGSQSLKHLSLSFKQYSVYGCLYTSATELPALTTLYLDFVTLCDDKAEKCVGIFLKCANLKNLTLKEFNTIGSNGISIRHPRLSNLTLENSLNVRVVNVTAPQLESLTINLCYAKHVVSAPGLASLVYKGYFLLDLSTDGFHSLEKADICVFDPGYDKANLIRTAQQKVIRLLRQLYNVHFLKLNLEIVELLSSNVGLLLHQPSPFANLKSLEIYPYKTFWSEQTPYKVAVSTELKSFLLDGSPKCTFTMVLREEIEAHNIMAQLEVILELNKDDTKIKKPKENIENIGLQVNGRKAMASLIISKLFLMEELLTRVSASYRAKFQPCFDNLCVEADIAVSKLTNRIKIQCDENQSRNELATTLDQSS